MPQRPLSVILIVIGTMAVIALAYTAALFWISVRGGDVETAAKAIEQFKDFGIYAAGALSGFLARTSTSDMPAGPIPAKITNTAEEPVPTDPQ